MIKNAREVLLGKEMGPKKNIHLAEDNVWKGLRLLAGKIRGFSGSFRYALLRLSDPPETAVNTSLSRNPGIPAVGVSLSAMEEKPEGTCCSWFRITHWLQAEQITGPLLPENISRLFSQYLPYCLMPLHARKRRKTVAVSHFAQSLDSFIAARNGKSGKIGNRENFIHAHRMRALLDGVLIGAETLRRDNPQLTVRLVEGDNPHRLVVGSSIDKMDCLTRASPDPVWLIGSSETFPEKSILCIPMQRRQGLIPTSRILRECYNRGLYTLYIEGGAFTTSLFLKENNLDVLQLHISPLMLGGGRPAFILSPSPQISQSLRFRFYKYTHFDRAVMFEGIPEKRGKNES